MTVSAREPELKHFAAVYMDHGSTDGWVWNDCPWCGWQGDYMVRMDSVDPAYLFQCQRNGRMNIECSGRWSLVKSK